MYLHYDVYDDTDHTGGVDDLDDADGVDADDVDGVVNFPPSPLQHWWSCADADYGANGADDIDDAADNYKMMILLRLTMLTMLMMLSKSSASPSSTNDPLRECLPSPQVSINQQSLYLQYNSKSSKVNSIFATLIWIVDLLTFDNRVIFHQ